MNDRHHPRTPRPFFQENSAYIAYYMCHFMTRSRLTPLDPTYPALALHLHHSYLPLPTFAFWLAFLPSLLVAFSSRLLVHSLSLWSSPREPPYFPEVISTGTRIDCIVQDKAKD